MIKHVFLIVTIVILSACRSTSDKIKNFIPGTYIHHFDNEFYKGIDTLKIEWLTENHYRLVDYGSYFNKTNKEMKYTEEISEGIYQEKVHELYDLRFEKNISFDPDKRLLYIGVSPYKKLE